MLRASEAAREAQICIHAVGHGAVGLGILELVAERRAAKAACEQRVSDVAHGAAMTVAEELVVAGRTVELVFVLQRGQWCVAAASGDLGVLSKVEARLALGALEAGCVVVLAKHLATLSCHA